MNLKELYSRQDIRHNGIYEWKKPVISFEVFPPKNEPVETLYKELQILNRYNPSFVSLTCGAGGGSSKGFSFDNLKHIKENLQINVMPHLTCICSSKEEVIKKLEAIESLDIKSVLALRGDEPQNIDVCYRDFRYANDLVSFIKNNTNFSVAVAGYPEGHINSPNLYTDIENLKRKVDAGADVIFTQLFFDNTKFFSYIQLIRDAGINIPVVAGIMPIISAKQIERMVSMAKITVPPSLQERIDRYKDDLKAMKELGINFASYQCQQLIDAEVSGLHFYTLNKSYSTSQILENIMGEIYA